MSVPYSCLPCKYGPTKEKSHFTRHLKSQKHKDNVDGKIKQIKQIYECKPCNYGPTDIKIHYDKHLETEKHKKIKNGEKTGPPYQLFLVNMDQLIKLKITENI